MRSEYLKEITKEALDKSYGSINIDPEQAKKAIQSININKVFGRRS